jgi:hypothetical protein
MNYLNQAQSKIKAWRENPVLFAWDNFRFEPDHWQKEVLELLPSQDPKHQRLSMQAAAGVGKSSILAITGWYFLTCYASKHNHPKAAAMSITGANLKDNLWAELSKWQNVSEFLSRAFTWTQSRIFANDHAETWFMSARSFSQSANAEEIGRTLSGLHSDYLLYLIDESGDIPPSVLRAAEQGLSTKPKWSKILQAGNPTSHTGMLYAAATSLRDQWHITRITSDPDDPRRSSRTDVEWAKQQIKAHGRNNPWVKSYILGEFPESALNTLLGPNDIELAMNRHLTKDKYEFSQKRLGVDVARFGDDSTIIFPRQGLSAFNFVEMKGARSLDVAARVMKAKNEWGSEMEYIDGTGGFGSGVIDSMIQAGYSPVEVHFSQESLSKKYLNKRAEMWFSMAEWIKRGGAIPKDNTLAKELVSPMYYFHNGKFKLEDKDQIKKRLGFSPDRADALALTFAHPEQMTAGQYDNLIINKKKGHQHEYDPFSEEHYGV